MGPSSCVLEGPCGISRPRCWARWACRNRPKCPGPTCACSRNNQNVPSKKTWRLVSAGGPGRRISLAREHGYFLFVIFLVEGGEKIPIVIDGFDFQLVVFTVSAGRWSKADGVLIAQEGRDGIENFVHLAFEAREPGVATGHLSESIQLVLGLQIVDLGEFGPDHALLVNAQGVEQFAHTNAENGGVGFFQVFEGLI